MMKNINKLARYMMQSFSNFGVSAVFRRVLVFAFFINMCFLSACGGGVSSFDSGSNSSSYSLDWEPVVITFEELRAPITMLEPQGIAVNGKIVVYRNYLLANDPSLGVHIFDNSDPSSPIALGFLPIVGVNDVTVKNNLLYADNYVDLVVFDISDMQQVKVVHRLENTFSPPYNASAYGVDENEGIVIGFVRVEEGV